MVGFIFFIIIDTRHFQGISTTAGITYITELSPINLRGMLGSTHQLFVTLGILISNILSFEFIFGTHKLWWIIFGKLFNKFVSFFVVVMTKKLIRLQQFVIVDQKSGKQLIFVSAVQKVNHQKVDICIKFFQSLLKLCNCLQ